MILVSFLNIEHQNLIKNEQVIIILEKLGQY